MVIISVRETVFFNLGLASHNAEACHAKNMKYNENCNCFLYPEVSVSRMWIFGHG